MMDGFLLPYAAAYPTDKTVYVYEFERNGYYDLERHAYSLAYPRFMDEYGLSERHNETFGYGRGHVPTFQYVVPNGKFPKDDPGVIGDMCVVYNDKRLNDTDPIPTISVSFFDGTRPLKYTDLNLKGRTLPAWRRAALGVYHDEAARRFFDYYLDKTA